ncbi:hypothetical protein [Thermoflavimicrobium daqui]|jgi:hypothetical protein|uniref:Uncharacterized protein n=1 Tax=Thermoflavimicrobium daqui TaxID=2137476 RepID=A0A364K1M4_9BACL|nr:hypothetical protein [Thermoflavimicrobium daqui]RAL21929.1 hypothetical protein DL897_15165 [Thermoflavimicrobium daqui]
MILLLGPIQELQRNILGPEIQAFFFLVVAGLCAWLVWKRQFIGLLGFLCLSFIAGIFIYRPDIIQGIAETIGPTLFRDWNK